MPRTQFDQIEAPDFDLAMTLDSGQVFHWDRIDNGAGGSRATWTGGPGSRPGWSAVGEPGGEAINGFYGAIGGRMVYVEQHKDSLKVRDGGAPSPAREARALPSIITNYFALDHPLAEICGSFPDDPIMNAAGSYCRGLRIIRQPKWECLATFICSSMKQVAHIRQISKKLRERFGESHRIDNHILYGFPPAARLAQSSEKELRECALGYRAKNLLAAALLVASGEADLDGWTALSDVDLRAKLCQLPGVGAKVANCVMLFAFERLRAFPVDVWIERVLREKYFLRKRKVTASRLRAFAETYFGEHGGYAQQYLFHHARTASRKRGTIRDSSTSLGMTNTDARTSSRKSGTARGSSTSLRSGRNDSKGARTASRKPAIEVSRPYLARERDEGRGGSPNRSHGRPQFVRASGVT